MSQIGAADVFIDTLSSTRSSETVGELRQRLAPTTTIGFEDVYEAYDVVVPKEACHSADLVFKLAQLFDPSARIGAYSQPVPIPAPVQQEARSMCDAVPADTKVVVVHADTGSLRACRDS